MFYISVCLIMRSYAICVWPEFEVNKVLFCSVLTMKGITIITRFVSNDCFPVLNICSHGCVSAGVSSVRIVSYLLPVMILPRGPNN